MIVTKFGGSSLADAAQFKKVKSILDMDSERKYVVPSAPGKRGPGDDKITDLLYAAHGCAGSKAQAVDPGDPVAVQQVVT